MRLFIALIEGKQSQVCQLGEVTGLFVTAWHAASRMQDWSVGAATKLMSTSSFLVHVLLQEVGQVNTRHPHLQTCVVLLGTGKLCLVTPLMKRVRAVLPGWPRRLGSR